ncbi:hypothetical protein BKA93DRAFT_693032, partial [Sparassis latifolia]
MKAFFNSLLNFNGKYSNTNEGALGVVKGYYGCVEAQGRGTLHCHMMIWVAGGLNPNQIKNRIVKEKDVDFGQRLLAFLDDSIDTTIPSLSKSTSTCGDHEHFFKSHPCSTRGINFSKDIDNLIENRLKDLHDLVITCQSHVHTNTCFKYWKGPPEPRECCFNLDESNVRSESSIDMESGELCLKCLNGLVNNFNATMLEAVRCNMDIKFIGSGEAAKAILYYITSYITKAQLKTHVAFSALELAIKKLENICIDEDDMTVRSKKVLQKCAFAILSHQELSAQQVASYLMDLEDHFTSHTFNNLYWTSFEKHIDNQQP